MHKIKGEVNMLNKHGKLFILFGLIAALLTASSCTSNPEVHKSKQLSNINYTSKQSETKNSDTVDVTIPEIIQELLNKIGSSTKIEIYHDVFNYFEPDYKPAVLTDSSLINLILTFFKYSIDPPVQDMSGMSVKDSQKLIFYNADQEQTIIPFAYDSLYNFGYIEYEGNKIYLSYDFFRLVANIETFRPSGASIPADVSTLFKKYNWTPAFLISSEKIKLPSDLSANSEDFQDKLYWSYNMELSKSEGMDFSKLLSKKVTAEIYNLIEPLPESARPYLDARGIIIRYDGNIAGAYIDLGTNSSPSFTLSGKSFYDIKGMEISEWFNSNQINNNDPLFVKVYRMSHEELIKTYFKAMTDKDEKTLLATMTTKQRLRSLFTNMERNKLYNKPEFGINIPGYAKKADIKEIKVFNTPENTENRIEYYVTVDITPTDDAIPILNKGVDRRSIILEKENGVWKIASDGH